MPDFMFHSTPQSTCSQRVRHVLHAKQVTFEGCGLDLFNSDQLQPAHLDRIRATAPFLRTCYFGSLLTEKYPHLRGAAGNSAAAA